jgi:hypothetical protein
MSRVRANLFAISPGLIRSRCKQVAAAREEYDFPDRLRTCEQYGALMNLFSGLDFERDNDLLTGALAVYGWMPTMMGELKSRDKLKGLIFDLSGTNKDHLGSILEGHRDNGALRSVNNSIVGTSKLLHFFLPDKIAIWDSVLGRSFGLVHHYQFSREDRFITYIDAVHEAIKLIDIPLEKLDIAVGDSICEISNIRRVEFALHAFGRQRSSISGSRPLSPDH